MAWLGLHILPLIVFILFPLVFAASYSIAVSHGHINAFFSYISDTGTNSPEMCVFSLGLSLAMVFVSATAYVRYMQVKAFLHSQSNPKKSTKTLNFIGLLLGVGAGVGTCMVGAFQETNVLSMHVVGAIAAFGGGSVFLIIQGVLTKHMAPQFGSNTLAYLRISCGVMCILLLVVCLSAGVVSFKHFSGTADDSLRWEPHHGGWEWRVLSTCSEWVMAALFDLYFLSFVPEFKRISFVPPQFRLVEVSTVKGKGNRTSSVMHQPVNNGMRDSYA